MAARVSAGPRAIFRDSATGVASGIAPASSDRRTPRHGPAEAYTRRKLRPGFGPSAFARTTFREGQEAAISVFETATVPAVARATAKVRLYAARDALWRARRDQAAPGDRPASWRCAIASDSPPPIWLSASSGCTGSITARRSGPRQMANVET
jgi:hypothetical protein